MALAHTRLKILSRRKGNTVGALAYRAGLKLICERTGLVYNYQHKAVQYVELFLPENISPLALALQKLIAIDRQKGLQALSNLVESYEKRKDAQVYREFEFALPRELTAEQGIELAREFAQDQICGRGMTVLLNFHLDHDKKTKAPKYHCHALMLTRSFTAEGLSPLKERAWNDRALGGVLREQFVAYTNFHLQKQGLSIRIDHRSYAEQGIALHPQPKLGRSLYTADKAALSLFPSHSSPSDTHIQTVVADTAPSIVLGDESPRPYQRFTSRPLTFREAEFNRIKLRNLYTVIARPEILLKRVTQNHTTFMWGDVEKALHHYIEDPSLIRKVRERLKVSPELVAIGRLKSSEAPSFPPTIYTTATLLQQEKRLVEAASYLAQQKTHEVSEATQEVTLHKLQEKFKETGGLAPDQGHALRHLLGPHQLTCLIGYAGTGKTALLEGALHAWKTEGYTVYGLAPTGRAAQNLSHLGLSSMTLHKFLRDYDKQRYHYKAASILVLDEAGMVDGERFEKLLQVTKTLGLKLVTIGDGAQLQSIEAGDAFRLVTARVPTAKLQTIVRQHTTWQRKATRHFGEKESQKAIALYKARGAFTFVKEPLSFTLPKTGVLPTWDEMSRWERLEPHALLETYTISRRMAGTISQYIREDMKAYQGPPRTEKDLFFNHQDTPLFQGWRQRRLALAHLIHQRLEACRPLMKAMNFPVEGFVKDILGPEAEKIEAREALKHALALPRIPSALSPVCDLRAITKERLVTAWAASLKAHPSETHLMLTYTHQDSCDLNQKARVYMRATQQLKGSDKPFKTLREDKDLFGNLKETQETRYFAVGDRLLFLKNKDFIKNGMVGTITQLKKRSITVRLDGTTETITFDPCLYKSFDHGYAPTIHKAQGITVDRSFILASYPLFENMAYVALTRHRLQVRVFCSSLDFWREEIIDVIAKTNQKLSVFDYLTETEIATFLRPSKGLSEKATVTLTSHKEAFKGVGKEAWNRTLDYLTGTSRLFLREELPEALSESERARLLEAERRLQASAPESLPFVPPQSPFRNALSLSAPRRITVSIPGSRKTRAPESPSARLPALPLVLGSSQRLSSQPVTSESSQETVPPQAVQPQILREATLPPKESPSSTDPQRSDQGSGVVALKKTTLKGTKDDSLPEASLPRAALSETKLLDAPPSVSSESDLLPSEKVKKVPRRVPPSSRLISVGSSQEAPPTSTSQLAVLADIGFPEEVPLPPMASSVSSQSVSSENNLLPSKEIIKVSRKASPSSRLIPAISSHEATPTQTSQSTVLADTDLLEEAPLSSPASQSASQLPAPPLEETDSPMSSDDALPQERLPFTTDPLLDVQAPSQASLQERALSPVDEAAKPSEDMSSTLPPPSPLLSEDSAASSGGDEDLLPPTDAFSPLFPPPALAGTEVSTDVNLTNSSAFTTASEASEVPALGEILSTETQPVPPSEASLLMPTLSRDPQAPSQATAKALALPPPAEAKVIPPPPSLPSKRAPEKPWRGFETYYYKREDIQRLLTPHFIEILFKEYIRDWVKNPIMKSHGYELRFGKNGGFVVCTQKALWYNHYDGQSGNIFQFIALSRNSTYKEAVRWVGERLRAPLSVYRTKEEANVFDQARAEALKAQLSQTQQEQEERYQKALVRVKEVWDKSHPIQGSLAEKYLRNHRQIHQEVSQDIRFVPRLYTERAFHPALVVFARNTHNELIGLQAIYLNDRTAGKARGLAVVKKSQGMIKGAAVKIQEATDPSAITYIAEGPETALSLREAGLQGTILASLGQANMAHVPLKTKRIVLCADYDGKNYERTKNFLATLTKKYEAQGYKVSTVWPCQKGETKIDFNDILQDQGPQKIAQIFKEIDHAYQVPQETLYSCRDPLAQGEAPRAQPFETSALSLKQEEKTFSVQAPTAKEADSPHVFIKLQTLLNRLDDTEEAFKRTLLVKDISYMLKDIQREDPHHLTLLRPLEEKLRTLSEAYRHHPALKASMERFDALLNPQDSLTQQVSPQTSPSSVPQEVNAFSSASQLSFSNLERTASPPLSESLHRIETLVSQLEAIPSGLKQKFLLKNLEATMAGLDQETLKQLEAHPSLKERVEPYVPSLLQGPTLTLD